jgi:hypothetical protein
MTTPPSAREEVTQLLGSRSVDAAASWLTMSDAGELKEWRAVGA